MTRNTRASIEVGLSGLGLEHQFRSYGFIFIGVVPGAGLEPARPQRSGDFKSPVSTNFTTRAERALTRARRIPRTASRPTPLLDLTAIFATGEALLGTI